MDIKLDDQLVRTVSLSLPRLKHGAGISTSLSGLSIRQFDKGRSHVHVVNNGMRFKVTILN